MDNIFDKAARELKENPPPYVPKKKSNGTKAADRYKSTDYWIGNIAEHVVREGNSIHASDGVDLFDREAVRHHENDRSLVIGDDD